MEKMAEQYRKRGEVSCIDLRVKHTRQLFDGRDPAPFRERDLDAGVVEYLTESAQELGRGPVRVEVFVSGEDDPPIPIEQVRAAFFAYFHHAELALRLRIRAHWRQGQIAAFVGLTVLVLLLFAAEQIQEDSASTWKRILREGLVIGAWVAIWRPVEHFLYDWWPFLAERRTLRRLSNAEIVVHYGVGGPGASVVAAVPPP